MPERESRLAPEFSAAVWKLQAGNAINAFGNGVAVPFVLIYLHNVLGTSFGLAGALLAASNGGALAGGPLAGPLIDRFGSRALCIGASLVSAASFLLLAATHVVWVASLALVLAGMGYGALNPGQSSLLAAMAPRERLPEIYAVQRLGLNLGIGAGAVLGGFVASSAHPATYSTLFLLDALSFLAFAGAVSTVAPRPTSRVRPVGASIRQPLTNRPFVGLLIIDVLVIGTAYAGLSDLMPAYAKNELGLSERVIGLVFAANTLSIVLGQLPVARVVRGRNRMSAYALEFALWSVAWSMIAFAGAVHSGSGRALVLAGSAAIVGLGECFHGVVRSALVVDLSQPSLVGRYLALSSFALQAGWSGGRIAGSLILAQAPHALWPLYALLALTGIAAARGLDSRLPPPIRITPQPQTEVSAPGLPG